MNAIQQKCRPKHQVLVLKCYPRMTKGAVDVKPNSSELSYLLFYAQSRRTKIQKVGAFLEKKTASDVNRQRIGNVQVTLRILRALIEKAPKDLPLLATPVLRILDQMLRSNDITMVESSIPTFESFCEHHDAAGLFADQTYLRLYETVVHRYASLASTRHTPGRVQSRPVAMRWRNSGLEAIRSITSADALSSVSGRQYDVVVPMILENLWTDNEDFLEVLMQRAQTEEKAAEGAMLRRRTSVATVRTVDTAGESNPNPNPIALAGSALDVDKLAEEDIGVLAMQCLKQIFVVPNRGQILAATAALLKFIEERVDQNETVVRHSPASGRDSGWAIKVFSLISRWTPVQDRYVILVTTMDALRRRTVTDATIQHHIALVAMVQSLLRSDANLIGLSVMDVVHQLILNIQRVVQLPGDPAATAGHSAAAGAAPALSGHRPQGDKSPSIAHVTDDMVVRRKELLGRLQQCLGDLATHIYYADQVSDMISAILLKLKPSRRSSTGDSSPKGERADPVAGAHPVAALRPGPGDSLNITMSLTPEEYHGLDSLFKLAVAKIAALKAVKCILQVANPQRNRGNSTATLSRNRVPVQVWENTHWLLRDPDGPVRKAYADALITWLDKETTRADQRARDEAAAAAAQRSANKSGRDLQVMAMTMARRAASTSSQREKPARLPRSNFLQLLHVAIYDNALQFVDYETDILLLHVLLSKLVTHLGVNAVRHGLAMVFRLQEDIQEAETPIAKVRIGSLCHGYFWLLTDKFDFEASVVGRAIHNEIVRRRSKHFWVEGVQVPAAMLELVGTPGMARPQPRLPHHEIESEALLPFDDRISLVECICTAYQETPLSPPGSPASSPSRNLTHPLLSSTLSTIPPVDVDREVPSPFREQMLAEWTRDAVLLAVQAGSKSASLSGSRTGTTGTNNRNRLAAGGANPQLNGHGGTSSPLGSQLNLRPSSQPNGPLPASLIPAVSKLRKSSVRSNLSRSAAASIPSSTPRSSVVVTTVDQLKLALSGELPAPGINNVIISTRTDRDDDSSDSMVSYDMAASEMSYSNMDRGFDPALRLQRNRSASRERKTSATESITDAGGPLTSHPTNDSGSGHSSTPLPPDPDVELVPPIPPLPATLDDALKGGRGLGAEPAGSSAGLPKTIFPPEYNSGTLPRAKRPIRGRGGADDGSMRSGSHAATGTSDLAAPAQPAVMDLNTLLRGIDSRAGESALGGIVAPPY